MKIAVTGASGFIGRHVLQTLLSYPIEVVAVTREEKSLAEFASKIQVVEYDISTANGDCYNHLGRPDILIHLAWDGLPNYFSLHHFETELPHQYRFLKEMIQAGLPSLAISGTCFEYGMHSGALSEDITPLPTNPYGFAKNQLRCQLEFLKREKEYKLTWMRLFYMYGEGQSSAIYSQLKNAIEQKEQIFNMSGGEQLRDYLHVEQVAKSIVSVAINNVASSIVNICSGKPTSVRCLVESWLDLNAWDIKLNLGYYAYPDYEPMAFWGKNDRLNNILTGELVMDSNNNRNTSALKV